MTMPKTLGRALAVAGAGAGLTSRLFAQAVGEEAHVQALSEMAAHAHGFTPYSPSSLTGSGAGSISAPGSSYPYAVVGATDTKGASAAANIMQPTTFLNAMVKL